MQYDWSSITSLAYLTLIEFDLREFPITANKIKCDGVKISSYQNYAKKTRLAIEEITLGNELEDAFLFIIPPNPPIILYDREKPITRQKHSLLHELGHIKLRHQKHGNDEEIEANFFAAQANAPNVLIKNIAQRGYTIDVPFLMECFCLSEESAKKKREYFNRWSFEHSNEYDDVVLTQFSEYINTKYPYKTQHFYDDGYFDELERKRENW